MTDSTEPPDPDTMTLAVAALLATAGKKPDWSSTNRYIWVWKLAGSLRPVRRNPSFAFVRGLLRADYWWADNSYTPKDTRTLSIGEPGIDDHVFVARPGLGDVLIALKDPALRKRFALDQE